MRAYGVPYKGSKNQLAEALVEALPTRGADTFVDLFAGGCAVTHAALVRGRYKRYVANDIDGQGVRLFMDSVRGKHRDERRWISREDFERLKATDPYVALCWSFGNNGKNYLYSREIEPWKKALHYARALGDRSLMEEFGIHTDGSRADIVAHADEYKRRYIRWWLSRQPYTADELDALIAKTRADIDREGEELRQYLLRGLRSSGLTQAEVQRRLGTQMAGHYFGRSQWGFPTEEYYNMMRTFMPSLDQDYNELVGLRRLWESLQSLQSLESLESLERLQSLERLERLQRLQNLETSFKSYDEVEIPEGSVVNCDPPYRGTDGYGDGGFDHAAFYDWCERQTELVVVSEYDMPRGRFVGVWSKPHRSRLCATANKGVTERLFVPRRQARRYYEMLGRPRAVQLELFPDKGRGRQATGQ